MRGTPALARRLVERLACVPGVRRVAASPETGRVLLVYAPAASPSPEELVDEVSRAAREWATREGGVLDPLPDRAPGPRPVPAQRSLPADPALDQGGRPVQRRAVWAAGAVAGLGYALFRPFVAGPGTLAGSAAVGVTRWCLTILAGYPILRGLAARFPLLRFLGGPALPFASLTLAALQEAVLSAAVTSVANIDRFRYTYTLSDARTRAALPPAALPPAPEAPPRIARIDRFSHRLNLIGLATGVFLALRRRHPFPVLAALLAANPRPAQVGAAAAQAAWVQRQADAGIAVIRPVSFERLEHLDTAVLAVEPLLDRERVDELHMLADTAAIGSRAAEAAAGGERGTPPQGNTALAVAAALAARWDPALAQLLAGTGDTAHGPDGGLAEVESRADGVRAQLAGTTWYLGEASFLWRRGVSTRRYRARAEALRLSGARVLWLAADRQVVALIALRRPVAPGAAVAVQTLRNLGVRELVLVGDLDPDRAQALQTELGADAWLPLRAPGERAAWVEERRRTGAVLYVGGSPADREGLEAADLSLLFLDGPPELRPSAHALLPAGGWDHVGDLVASALVARELAEQSLVATASLNVWGLVQVLRGQLGPSGASRLIHLATLGASANAHRLAGSPAPPPPNGLPPAPARDLPPASRVLPMAGGSQLLTGDGGPILGLSQAEALRRLERYGPNRLPEVAGASFPGALVRQLGDPMVLTLAGTALLSGWVGRWIDTASILGILALNGLLGAYQEYRAERAILGLRDLTHPRALVERDGQVRAVPAESVVPGDVLWLQPGERVAADAHVLEAHGLEVDESALTGESLPVVKRGTPFRSGAADTPWQGEHPDRVYMGSSVVRGTGRVLVLRTGASTLMGKTIGLMCRRRGEGPQTPIQRRGARLSRQLALLSLVAGGAVALAGWRRGLSVAEMLLTGVSMGVAAVPEGLPALITIGLSVGVQRMARRHALVRRLGAVEEMGEVDVICTDKTGTLTENRIELVDIACGGAPPPGGAGGAPSARPAAGPVLELAALTNRRWAPGRDGQALPPGDSAGWVDPLEAAIERALDQEGLGAGPGGAEGAPPLLGGPLLRLVHLPFDAEFRYSASVVTNGETPWLVVKGAPETVLPLCHGPLFAPAGQAEWSREEVLALTAARARQGFRVLAVAGRPLPAAGQEWEPARVRQELEQGNLAFAGLLFFRDPVRPGVYSALQQMRAEGRRVIMVTGDHPLTALSVATELDLAHPDSPVVTGAEVEAASTATLQRWVQEVPVFARVAPHQKLRIVETLERLGHRVAMTGEGVNDVPAIRRAHVGIALSAGTEVTREAADIVLTDDSFDTIAVAGAEGRRVRRGIESAVGFLISGNAGEVATMLGALAMGLPIPLQASHLLLVNLFTDALPALALAVRVNEAPLQNGAASPARNGRNGRVRGGPGGEVGARDLLRHGLVTGAATLTTYRALLRRGGLERARSGVLAAVVGDQLLHLPAWDPLEGTAGLWTGVLGKAQLASWASLLAVLYTPLRCWFGLQPLGLTDWLWVLLPGLAASFINRYASAIGATREKGRASAAAAGQHGELDPHGGDLEWGNYAASSAG